MTGAAYLSLWDTTHAICKLAETEGAPAISEWHVIRQLIESRGQDLTNMQIRTQILLQSLEEALDIRMPTTPEATRTWCFCDTSFFLETKRSFWDVDWGAAFGFGKRVVLVVPPAIMDELDEWRVSDNERFGRLRKRARSVVRRMDTETSGQPYGEPVRVTDDVQLVRFGWEPRKTPQGLTNTLAADRRAGTHRRRRARSLGHRYTTRFQAAA
jgi:hypothetical protein